MILQENEQPNFFVNFYKKYRFRLSIGRVLLVLVLLIAAVIFLSMKFSLLLHDNGLTARPVFMNLDKIPGNYIKGLMTTPERIVIDIKHKHFQKLAYKRKVAMERSLLVTSDDDWVPAKIRYGSQTLKSKLRLKGDMLDHLGDEKWSFRVKLSGENTLFGMKIFSLQHPKTRGYIAEWLLHQMARMENIISLRYKFVNVVVNGKDLGIFAFEEHIDKRLIENNARREGPVIKYDESNWWSERLRFLQRIEHPIEIMGGSMVQARQGVGSYYSMPVDLFQGGKNLANSVQRKNFMVAHELLEKFRNGELSPSQVFDVKKLAAYVALNDLFGNRHALHTNNLRFYYNPVISRLEIVPFDAGSISELKGLSGVLEDTSVWGGNNKRLFLRQLFSDMNFWEVYIQALDRFSQPAYTQGVLTALEEPMEAVLNIIYSDFPYYIFNPAPLEDNQDYIRYVLNPENAIIAYGLQSELGQMQLEVGNKQSLPIEVLGVTSGDTFFKVNSDERVILPNKRQSDPVAYRRLDFVIPADLKLDLAATQVTYKVLGTKITKAQEIASWPRHYEAFAEADFLRNASDVNSIEFIEVNPERKTLFIKPGKWVLKDTVVLPAGYRVFASSGVELDLVNSAMLLSRSPVEFVGTETKPIVIHSSDASGQGFMVVDGEAQSIITYAIFKNLANPSKGGWSTTGSVTFYQSPVLISHAVFSTNHAEDALNIIRCDYEINDSLFENTQSDAFDADFANGSINRTVYANSGNDAIDISGSVLVVNDSALIKANDKGLSAGEGSTMTVNNIKIKGTEIAVASKDLSDIQINGLTLEDNTVGFAVFMKKPEFGAASVTVKGITDNQKQKNYLVEAGSSLIIDDVAIEANNSKVKALLYGAEYGMKTVR